MKKISILLLVFLKVISVSGQKPNFQVKFSESLAVFEFVHNLSAYAPNNPFKELFTSSKFNQEKYKKLITEFDQLKLEYNYEYPEYPYAQKIIGSTESLLKKNMINSRTMDEFKINSLGIIPNANLLKLISILSEFTPIYRELVYQPNKEKFEKQLNDIKNLIASKNMTEYFNAQIRFFNSSWDNSIPIDFVFYPIPLSSSQSFTAHAFYNNAQSAIPTGLTDYNLLLGVIFHEISHILYDEQTAAFKKDIEKWFISNPHKSSRYAYMIFNESLATATGNGYIYGKLNGQENEDKWYGVKYINLMAKKAYPLVKDYISNQRQMDKLFVDSYIKLYEDNFSEWLSELENLMVDRFVLTDNREDFNVINQKFPWAAGQEYVEGIAKETIEKMAKSPSTKIIIVSKANKNNLQLIKQNFPELKNWKPNDKIDFTYSVFLEDKTYLIIINSVKNTTEKQLETLKLK